MVTLVSSDCGQSATMLFCADGIGLKPTPAVIPAVALAINTFNEVQGGAASNPVPLPATAAIGDVIVSKYLGGNVSLVLPAVPPSTEATVVYAFNPVGDLNKVITVRWNGLEWELV